MSTTKDAGSAQPATKKLRRGISNETRAVSQLKFHEKDAAQNGLFIGHLHAVTVEWSTSNDSASFNGISIPRLQFHFASNHANEQEMRHVYQTLFPVESSVDTIPGGAQEWRVNNVFAWIKHILDVFYLKGRKMTEAEENALELPFVDFDEEGQFVVVDPQDVANGYRSLFENAAAMLNGTFNLADGEPAKPCFKSADGKYLECWMKLLRCKKVKNTWKNVAGGNAAGDLAFDFIGSGVVELKKGNTPPMVLRLDLSKESITPKEVSKEPTIGTPMGGMNQFGNVTAPGGMAAPMNGAFAEAGQGDMPF